MGRIPLLILLYLIAKYHGIIVHGFPNYFDADADKDPSWNFTFGTEDLEVTEMNVFYDLKTGSPFRISSIENSLLNPQELSDQSFTKSGKILRRIGYRANGCSCEELTCGCCLGINFNQFNFNREGCMKFTYLPDDFAINMEMIMNDEPIFSNSLSAKNPPPLCVPFTVPGTPIATPLDLCAKIYDIYTQDRNIHMCFDLVARFSQAEILVLHFDCMVMGGQGLQPLKPGQSIPISTTTEIDIYDPVNETKY